MISNTVILNLVYVLFVGWTLFSIYYIVKLWKTKNTSKYNPYIYSSIPSVFTTLGVLGTFSGIFFGLQDFDVEQIDKSIPILLKGMKTAFSTSIIGIVLSLVFRPLTQKVLRLVELKEPPKQTSELSALSEMIYVLKNIREESNTNFDKLNSSLIGESDTSISTQFIKLRNQVSDGQTLSDTHNKLLINIQDALVGTEKSSLLTQFEKLRAKFSDSISEYKNQKAILGDISNAINSEDDNSLSSQMKQIRIESIENNNSIKTKFNEFGELLKKNNTEALVDVMKKSTELFNTQMGDLIEKLVQENFNELNNSVQNLNHWQKENKEMISTLTSQFINITNEFGVASISIKEITDNTSKLTSENSNLTSLIKELQKVMIDDTKFQEITTKLVSVSELVMENIEAFDETTNKLNSWVQKEHSVKQSVDILISKLHEIEEIRDVNGAFWKETKKQMNEGVGIIADSSRELRRNLDGISIEFTGQLTETLTSLDELIQRLVMKYRN